MDTSHLTPEERGEYFLLTQKWQREARRKQIIWITVAILITLLAISFSHEII
jgi:hypothetical protein